MGSGHEDHGRTVGALVDPTRQPRYAELSDDFPDEHLTLLDQRSVALKNISPDQQQWRDVGCVIKRAFVPAHLCDEYVALRERLGLGLGIFPSAAPYIEHEVIRDIFCSRELHYLLVDLVGEELGLHFNLSNFTSTERGWHQDDYLNPENTFARYCAIWVAVGDIDPRSGPFEYVPGSHKWPTLRREKVRGLVKPEFNSNEKMEWPIYAEAFVNKAVTNEIADRHADITQFAAKKGDILIWHGRLLHRGSIPTSPGMRRPAVIGHYSNVRDRRDFSNQITRHRDGGYFWDFGQPVGYRPAAEVIASPRKRPTLARRIKRFLGISRPAKRTRAG